MIDPLLVINIIILILLVRAMYRKVRYRPLGKLFLPGLMLKFLAGIALGFYYIIYFQGGDTMLFYEDATHMARAAFDHPGQYLSVLLYNNKSNDLWGVLTLTEQPRALFMAKILSLFHILTNGNYWISGFYFSLFSFTGLWILADKLTTYFPWSKYAAAAAFIFFPSVIFWSSGVSKEAISTGLISWIIAIYMPALARGEGVAKRKIMLSLLFLFFLWTIKYYYAAMLFAVLLPTLIVSLLKSFSVGISWNFNKQILYWCSFLVWSIVIASFIHPNLRLTNIADVMGSNHELFVQLSSVEDLVKFDNFSATLSGFVKNLPRAVYAGLFQPVYWEVKEFPKILVGAENLVILVFAIFSLVNISRINVSNNGILVIGALTYILITAVFLAFSTPNIGTLTRYKSGFSFLFIYIVLVDPFFKRLIHRFFG